MHRDLGSAPGQKEKIRAAPADAAPILATCLPKGQQSLLLSHLVDARAELHGRMCHIFAASPQSNGSDDCCKNDSAFHGLLHLVSCEPDGLNALPDEPPANRRPRRVSWVHVPRGDRQTTRSRPPGPRSQSLS